MFLKRHFLMELENWRRLSVLRPFSSNTFVRQSRAQGIHVLAKGPERR